MIPSTDTDLLAGYIYSTGLKSTENISQGYNNHVFLGKRGAKVTHLRSCALRILKPLHPCTILLSLLRITDRNLSPYNANFHIIL